MSTIFYFLIVLKLGAARLHNRALNVVCRRRGHVWESLGYEESKALRSTFSLPYKCGRCKKRVTILESHESAIERIGLAAPRPPVFD